MLMLPAGLRVSIYREPVDMRKSFDGLEALVREGLGADPLSGQLFVFCNRRRDRMKLLLWDETGFWIWYKRLEGGRFHLPESGSVAASELALVLEGLDLSAARRQRRWRRPSRSWGLRSKPFFDRNPSDVDGAQVQPSPGRSGAAPGHGRGADGAGFPPRAGEPGARDARPGALP
jgi:transposase